MYKKNDDDQYKGDLLTGMGGFEDTVFPVQKINYLQQLYNSK